MWFGLIYILPPANLQGRHGAGVVLVVLPFLLLLLVVLVHLRKLNHGLLIGKEGVRMYFL